jgi:hypothetical protein
MVLAERVRRRARGPAPAAVLDHVEQAAGRGHAEEQVEVRHAEVTYTPG